MAASISPQSMVVGELNPTSNPETSYSGLQNQRQAAQNMTRTQLKPIDYIHGEHTVKFTMEEREVFANEEGLHREIVIKLSSGTSDLKDLRTLLLKHFGVKGHCLIGSLAPRQLLLSSNKLLQIIAIGDVDARELMVQSQESSKSDMDHIHDVVARSEYFGQYSWLNVAKKLMDKNSEVHNLQFPSNSTQLEHSISKKHATGDESMNKINLCG
ncbi:hypothetical protein BC332_16392 [Capsicum chinense]|nr:hypothetical protein BC332_16392 [Capsicum chinense]